ncbi:ClbS/DfsB family four-helix bundle protein [Georgenia sp. TF02-10]|uniref:ClbS/DfsB family four-helix bundle protein n=1 Tax=Georgenia sp. TF02-10 TaxID=2917725 RepID=UPI001FA6AFAB|nr:ClbS/DfsB family four-helix bundle protein [Georgenia sp. TF02-10]UNX56225.1 ClbS/DfsB family four-helix bundle protein [Georgenia sp. TF02-10]
MAVPSSKDELIATIEKSFTQLSADLDRVPLARVREPVLEGHVNGTTMSPADLVAYLIGWNQQVLIWHRRRAEGLPDEFPAHGARWNELGLLAQRYYAEHQSESWDDLRTQLTDAKNQIIALIHRYSNDDLYGEQWYGRWTMGRMISLNTSSPYTNARGRIRAWLCTL